MRIFFSMTYCRKYFEGFFLELKFMSLKSFLKEEVILVVFCIGVDKQTFLGCLITLTKSDVSFKYNLLQHKSILNLMYN